MEITLKNIDAVNAVIKVDVSKEDYAASVENSLKKVKKKTNMPGFRKGMVPMGVVKKICGASVMAEEINELVIKELYAFIRENKLDILGEPLPCELERPVNFEEQEDFEFCFDIALAPEITIELNKRDRLPYYFLKVDDEMLDQQINTFRSRYGSHIEVDEYSGCELVKGNLAEWENGALKPDGLLLENALMMPACIIDEEERVKFDHLKKGDSIIFNLLKAYDYNEVEIASFLGVERGDIKNHMGDFCYEIKEIDRHLLAEIGQEFFDKIFPSGEVTEEADFRERIRASIIARRLHESDYRFMRDFGKIVNRKLKDIQFPEKILRRWMLLTKKGHTEETMELDYQEIMENLKMQLVKERLVKRFGIKVEKSEIVECAEKMIQCDFAQYGIMSVHEDIMGEYLGNMLRKKGNIQDIADRVMDEKLIACIRDLIKVEDRELPPSEFDKLTK